MHAVLVLVIILFLKCGIGALNVCTDLSRLPNFVQYKHMEYKNCWNKSASSLLVCVRQCFVYEDCTSVAFELKQGTCCLLTDFPIVVPTDQDVNYVWTKKDSWTETSWMGNISIIPSLKNSQQKQTKGDCNSNFTEYRGHYFKMYYPRRTWDEAEERCVKYGGHLATMDTRESLEAAADFAVQEGGTQAFWVGLKIFRDQTNRSWADGTPLAKRLRQKFKELRCMGMKVAPVKRKYLKCSARMPSMCACSHRGDK